MGGSMIALRDYQQRAVDQLRDAYREGKRAPLLVLATGGGKTVVFAHVAHGAAEKGKRVLILTHRAEILRQCSRALTATNTAHGIIAPGNAATDHHVQLASVFTAARRIGRMATPDLVVIDEAHHAAAGSWSKIIEAFPNAKIMGVTATPERLDGRGLGAQSGGFFDAMIQPVRTSELVARGFLAKPRVFAPPTAIDLSQARTTAGDYNAADVERVTNRREIIGDIVGHYARICPNEPAIAFAVSLAHANAIADAFKSAGFRSEVIDGTQDDARRSLLVNSLASGALHVLVSCDLISEGFDVPVVRAAILARPTQSLGLALQQMGRALRPAPGKPDAIILDHAGNVERHGFPDEDREWSLDAAKRKRKRADDEDNGPAIRQCPSCFAINRAGVPVCAECGHVFASKTRKVDEREGELIELTPEMIAAERAKRERRREEGQARTFESLVALGRSRGYPNPEGWARHRLEARARAARVA
jgi:superfamily II DNA or RNA helicase